MDKHQLLAEIRSTKSFLCVGLDTDVRKLPEVMVSKKDSVFEFNRAIIDATADLSVAYKPNLAFYEAQGAKGWDSLHRTVHYIKEKYPRKFIIADAKRGDIANTAENYARSLLRELDVDAVTLAPYMGRNAVSPFLDYAGKWAILLALTSNESYGDFQTLLVHDGGRERALFEVVLERSRHWGHDGNMMYVVGATRAEMLREVRAIVPDHFLLIPGVGKQGGSLEDVVEYGMTRECGLLVNSSRGILYADSSHRFAEAARAKAEEVQKEMVLHLEKRGVV